MKTFRTIAKIGVLLGGIGFMMPMVNIKLSILRSAQLNGFELAQAFFELDAPLFGILLYASFAFIVVGLLIGVLLLAKKNVPVALDWVILLACIGCGLGVFLGGLLDDVNKGAVALLLGAYVIALGWIVALIAQIISSAKKEK